MKDDRGIEWHPTVSRSPTPRLRTGVVVRFGLRGLVQLAWFTVWVVFLSIPLWIIAGWVANGSRGDGEAKESAVEALNLSTEIQVALAGVVAVAALILMIDGFVSRLRRDADTRAMRRDFQEQEARQR